MTVKDKFWERTENPLRRCEQCGSLGRDFDRMWDLSEAAFRLLVFGSRSFRDRRMMYGYLDKIKQGNLLHVITGCAKGADWMAIEWSLSRAVPFTGYPADWKRSGKTAGIVRNERMGEVADWAIGFWDGRSPGSGHMISLIEQHNSRWPEARIRLKVVRF